MNDLKNEINTVLVCGDLIIDNHIYKGSRKKAATKNVGGTEIIRTLGGAHLTYSLLRFPNNTEEVISWYNSRKAFEEISKRPEDQAYAEWDIVSTDKCSFKQALGFGNVKKDQEELKYQNFVEEPEIDPDILVIDEGGLGFREHALVEGLPKSKCYILKTNSPLADGKLWKTLTEQHSRKLITLLSINELRKYDIKISKGISWEQTCLDLCYELVTHKALTNLLKSKFLVISMGAAGAIIIKDGDNEKMAEFAMVFDPEYMEGDWEQKLNLNCIGQMCAFTAGFTYNHMQSMAPDPEEVRITDIMKSVKKGTYYLRKLLVTKFKWSPFRVIFSGEVAPYPEFNEENLMKDPGSDVELKPQDIFELSDAFIPSPYWYASTGKVPIDYEKYLNENLWSIFLNNYDHLRPLSREAEDKKKKFTKEIVLNAAMRTAQKGINQLMHVPYLKCNFLFTIDRNEIESLRNIRKLILQYIAGKSSKPFNLAVFGPPGAGKSFAVEQIAYSIFDKEDFDDKAAFLTFNLSQFRDETELAGAFHTIRDLVLLGKMPFVFWDEFDSGDLGWLQYFLAPMQDGVFQEGKDTHPIGRCIFIFAGGTVHEMQTFEPIDPRKYSTEEKKEAAKLSDEELQARHKKCDDFKAKKGTDFKSRLHAYINILGPNRKMLYNCIKDHWIEEDPSDHLYPVRRALFLRSSLRKKPDEELQMDPGLIRSFLTISKYNHGSRSLRRILDHLSSGPTKKISRSALPSGETMNLHVDFEEFMKIANDHRNQFPLEELAQNIHLSWLGIVKDANEKNIYRKEYLKLSEDMKYDNFRAAERLKSMLEEKKFEVVTKEDPRKDRMSDFKSKIIGNNTELEKMAKKEHQGWKEAREEAGWQNNGKIRSDFLKYHPSLLDDDPEKMKDINTIKKIPIFFEHPEFKIINDSLDETTPPK